MPRSAKHKLDPELMYATGTGGGTGVHRPQTAAPGQVVEPEVLPRPARGGGPRTAAGKAAVSRNAVTHGVYSTRLLLAGEDEAALQAFVQGYVDYYEPLGVPEHEFAVRIAEILWRLRRIGPAEAHFSAVARGRVESDYRSKTGILRPDSLAAADRRIAAASEALNALTAFVDDTESIDPHTVTLSPEASREFLGAVGNRNAAWLVTEPADRAWPLTQLLGAIGMAATEGKDKMEPEALSEIVRGRLQASLDRHLQERDLLVAEQDHMRRERVLPLQDFAQLAKYEAHLCRQLAQAMSALEALQARRKGAPIPLARVHFESGA